MLLPRLLLTISFTGVLSWVPPGMSEHYDQPSYQPADQFTDQHPDSQIHEQEHHQHQDSENVADIVTDTEHIIDDLGEVFTEQQINRMNVDEQLFLWFESHDWDESTRMDGLELFKALSHDHNYHHEEDEDEEFAGEEHERVHDPVQHTPAAERTRFRRTEKIVDRMLDEDDSDKDGELSFPEFVAAFRAGKMDGLKVKKNAS